MTPELRCVFSPPMNLKPSWRGCGKLSAQRARELRGRFQTPSWLAYEKQEGTTGAGLKRRFR